MSQGSVSIVPSAFGVVVEQQAFLFFETGYHSVALAGLELAAQNRLAS